MNHPFFSRGSLEYLFYDYERKNVLLIFLYLFLTLGLYAIPWIYYHNKKFEEIDPAAPDSKRGAFILFILPILIYSFFLVAKTIFFQDSFELRIAEIIVWSLEIFLTLKYVYEFCESVGRLTVTKTWPWYLFVYIGYCSYILALFGIVYALFALIVLFIGIVSMQEAINVMCYRVKTYRDKERFNSMPKSMENNNHY